MTNLKFRDSLVEDTFIADNDYIYASLTPGKIRFCTDSENYPVILQGSSTATNKITISYAYYHNQFNSRVLTAKKIKEVMDSSRYPIMIKLREKTYFIGKGYMGYKNNLFDRSEPEPLFVACINGKNKYTNDLKQVKFFVNRKVFNEDYKPMHPVVKDFINYHVGDVIITDEMEKYIGETIKLPVGGDLATQKKYRDAVVMECLDDLMYGKI